MNVSLNCLRAFACGASVRSRGVMSSFVREMFQSPTSTSSKPRSFIAAQSFISKRLKRRLYSCRVPEIRPNSWLKKGFPVPFTA